MNASDWVLIIGAVAAGVVTILRGLHSIKDKLDVIHKDTNGNLGKLQLELAVVRNELRKEKLKMPEVRSIP